MSTEISPVRLPSRRPAQAAAARPGQRRTRQTPPPPRNEASAGTGAGCAAASGRSGTGSAGWRSAVRRRARRPSSPAGGNSDGEVERRHGEECQGEAIGPVKAGPELAEDRPPWPVGKHRYAKTDRKKGQVSPPTRRTRCVCQPRDCSSQATSSGFYWDGSPRCRRTEPHRRTTPQRRRTCAGPLGLYWSDNDVRTTQWTSQNGHDALYRHRAGRIGLHRSTRTAVADPDRGAAVSAVGVVPARSQQQRRFSVSWLRTVALNLRENAANPADLERGRSLGPADGQRETLAVETYQLNKVKPFTASTSTTSGVGGGQ